MMHESKNDKKSHKTFVSAARFFPGEQIATPSATGDHKGLPPELAANMEDLSGYDLSDVRVHYNSADAGKMNALAFAKGTDIHIGPGQETHLAHEAWHVVQQKQGRVSPTSILHGEPANEDPTLEKEADEMGAMALQGKRPGGEGQDQVQEEQKQMYENGCGCAAKIIQCYREENDRSLFNEPCPLTTQQLITLYTMNRGDDMTFSITNREGNPQTVRFTYNWVVSYEGLAIIRSRIRYNFSREVPSGEQNIRTFIASLDSSPESRLTELNEMLRVAVARNHANPDTADDSAPYLLEEAINSGLSYRCRGYVHHRTSHLSIPAESEQQCYADLEPVVERFLIERGESPEQIERMRRQYSSGHLVRWHAAWDITGPMGTAVYSPLAGTVVLTTQSDSYGNYVRIRHDQSPTEAGGTETVFTNYCHLSRFLVQENDAVFPGQAIGLVGNSGGVSTHLHFSVQNRDSGTHRLTSPHEVSAGLPTKEWWQRVTGSSDPYHNRVSSRERTTMERDFRRSERNRSREEGARSTTVQRRPASAAVIQFVRPSYIVSHNFMGLNIPVGRGVHPDMKDRLVLVEEHLQAQYDALPVSQRPASLREYAGLKSIKGWRDTTSKHGTGKAVDVNYTDQPYIATRTVEGGSTTYGGEQGGATAGTRALRQPAVEVYDRAVSFTRRNPFSSDSADVGNRRQGESATDAYRRFRGVSDALAAYLSLAFLTNYDEVNRVPVGNPDTVPEADLLTAIPTTERKDEATAVADIQAYMDDLFWQILHPSYPLTAREQYIRILRDYEIVRRPMQFGNPDTSPARTRNPARGFLHMPEHFVVAMMDIGGLRWGACEFSARSNGDVHHFDLGTPHHSPVS